MKPVRVTISLYGREDEDERGKVNNERRLKSFNSLHVQRLKA
jgi:hypothetical protein